jgi:hypothetical protein
MSNEVMNRSGTDVAVATDKSGEVLRSDIVIPKLLLMQGLSELVTDRKAQLGDIVRSTTAAKLGDDKQPVEFIPLAIQNAWMIQEDQKGNGKYEFRRYEPRTAKNEDAPWDYVEAGSKWKRTKVMNVYALLPKDVEAQDAMLKNYHETGEAPDVNNVLLPVVIPFRNTSFSAGKTVATHFAKAESLSQMVGKKIPAHGTTFQLHCFGDKNDKGAFFVYKVETKGKTDAKYLTACQTWYSTLSTGAANIRVDDRDDNTSDAKEEAVSY